jgi:glycosyltransferase involved in cell wall biosynthesis
MGYAHGLDYVLQAAKLLSVDSAIHFVFVGDGSARAQLENLARALNLHNVTFCDPVPVEQLPPYFSIALCGLASLRDLPTHDGARPSKIFPVLASGKPIILVGKGECARLINEARAGLVVPPENPQAFAAAISTFFADSGALRQCGANGRQFVENHYDWSKLISEWLTQLAASKISDTEVRASHAIANPKA